MAKSQFQKAKLIYILKILQEFSDEEHAVSTREIIDRLGKLDIHAERKTIYADIEELKNIGYDILKRDSRNGGGYFLASRRFELPELKLLVDAVQSTRFITPKKSRELIHKLENLTSRYEAVQLQRQVYVAGRPKTENEGIYYNVDAIYRSIQNDNKLAFYYLFWNEEKKLEEKNSGKRYVVSPWAMIWQDENYYLAAYDSDADEIRHYRVDKMGSVQGINEKREGKEIFEKKDLAQYSTQMFGMFGGKKSHVTVQIKKELLGVMIDRFGKDIFIRKDREGRFLVQLTVVVSQQFFGWIAGLGKDVSIISPSDVREEYKDFLLDQLQHYEDEQHSIS